MTSLGCVVDRVNVGSPCELLPWLTIPSMPNGAFKVKVAEAAFELESVIVTVLVPEVVDGAVKVTPENEPVAFVVVVPLSVTPNPAKVAVNTFEAPKPEPETVTVVPGVPVVGLRVMAGVTVNVAETVLVPSVA